MSQEAPQPEPSKKAAAPPQPAAASKAAPPAAAPAQQPQKKVDRNSPEFFIQHFFRSLAQLQFPVCWNLFSSHTQRQFLNWTLQQLYSRHEKAAKSASMGLPEVKFMFETNDQSLIQLFWRHFVKKCAAEKICRFAYFNTVSTEGNKATVEVKLVYPTGEEEKFHLLMVKDRGNWKFGYIESGLPF